MSHPREESPDPDAPRKRQWTEESDKESEDSKPTRHIDLYFDDGNIVLIADEVAFRVHSSILSLRSPVFKDMLAMPQPASTDTFDGCPVVNLPDCWCDVAPFLDFIYNGCL